MYGHQPRGLLESIFGWLLAALAVLLLLNVVIAVFIQLLPWLGLLVFVGVLVRWWLYRNQHW